MPKLLAVQNRSGANPFGPLAFIVPAGGRRIRIAVDSNSFTDPATHIFVIVEEWRDDGQFPETGGWRGACKFDGQGGQTDRFGQPSLPSGNVDFREGEMQIRGTINVTGTVRFGLDVDVQPL